MPTSCRTRLATALCWTALLSIPAGAQRPWPLWQHYTQHFLDPSGRIVDHSAQQHNDRTTSEAQAYALFFALVDNDRSHFDRILAWTEANLAAGDLAHHLPAWQWGKTPDGTWNVLDPNPAADADLWLAYTLLQAGRLWHTPRYTHLGTLLANRIAQQEIVDIPGLGPTLIPAPQGFHPDSATWIVNPSYLPLPVLTCLARRFPNSSWPTTLQSLKAILSQGSGAGFVMDWIAAGPTLHPAIAPSAPEQTLPTGGYDAIRVYLWLGLADPATPGLPELLKSTSGMAAYLRNAPSPPRAVAATGLILESVSPPGFSAAVIPYLQALNFKSQQIAQQIRLASLQDPASGLFGPAYYDQNLALFSTGWSEHRFRFDRHGTLIPTWREPSPSPPSSPVAGSRHGKNIS